MATVPSEQTGAKGPWARLQSDLRRRYPAAPGSADGEPAEDLLETELEHRLTRLPPEIGTLLMVIGIAGLLLPGPVGSPFVVAGGLALWPAGFGRVEAWFRRRFPRMHHEGMGQIERFLTDLERRYPGSIREG